MTKGWSYITPKEFDVIKTLFRDGHTTHQIARLMNRGECTIHNIRNSETFEDYKKYLADANFKRWGKGQKPDQQPGEVIIRRWAITEEEFNKIHQLHQLGVGRDQVAEFAKRSTGLVDKVMRRSTWQDYQDYLEKERELGRAWRQKTEENPPPKELLPTDELKAAADNFRYAFRKLDDILKAHDY